MSTEKTTIEYDNGYDLIVTRREYDEKNLDTGVREWGIEIIKRCQPTLNPPCNFQSRTRKRGVPDTDHLETCLQRAATKRFRHFIARPDVRYMDLKFIRETNDGRSVMLEINQPPLEMRFSIPSHEDVGTQLCTRMGDPRQFFCGVFVVVDFSEGVIVKIIG